MKMLNITLFLVTEFAVTILALCIMRACCHIQEIDTAIPYIKYTNIIVSSIGFVVAFKMFPLGEIK